MNSLLRLFYLSVLSTAALICLFLALQAQPLTAAKGAVQVTPIVGGTGFGSAVQISPDIEYSGAVSNTHTNDYLYFDVTPGQIVSLVYNSTEVWGNANLILYDQDHASSLLFKNLNSAEQSGEWQYAGNDTTPTRYYFRIQQGGAVNQYLFRMALRDQNDGGPIGDAGESGATARLITPTLGSISSYTGTMQSQTNSQVGGGNDGKDWYRIQAVSGMILTVTTTIVDYGGCRDFTNFVTDQGTTSLLFQQLSGPDVGPVVFRHAANNTNPSAYLLKLSVGCNSTTSELLRYRFEVEASQQSDANQPGDAGDDFDSARVITPSAELKVNLLGSADDDDFYKVNLPDVDPFDPVILPYTLFMAPLPWPAGSSGSLNITVYAANRSPKGSPYSIVAPTTDAPMIDLTGCDDCFVKVSDNSAGVTQLQYEFQLVAITQIYLPVALK